MKVACASSSKLPLDQLLPERRSAMNNQRPQMVGVASVAAMFWMQQQWPKEVCDKIFFVTYHQGWLRVLRREWHFMNLSILCSSPLLKFPRMSFPTLHGQSCSQVTAHCQDENSHWPWAAQLAPWALMAELPALSRQLPSQRSAWPSEKHAGLSKHAGKV